MVREEAINDECVESDDEGWSADGDDDEFGDGDTLFCGVWVM